MKLTATDTLIPAPEGVPFYEEEWYAWSASSTGTSSPSDVTAWSKGTPARVTGKQYLWRRSRLMTWSDTLNDYSGGSWTYVCLRGTDGTSIDVKGAVALYSQLESNGYVTPEGGTRKQASDGDCYVLHEHKTIGGEDKYGHLYQWNTEAGSWLDLGTFQGSNGQSSYTHLVWAKKDPTASGYTFNQSDFTIAKSGSDTVYLWMGLLVDNKVEDEITASNYLSFKWSYTKGVSGEDAILADLDNEMDGAACDSSGYTTAEQTIVTNVWLMKGVTKQSISSVACTIGGVSIGSSYAGTPSAQAAYYCKVAISGLNTTQATVTLYIRERTPFKATPFANGKIALKITVTSGSYVRDLTLTVSAVLPGSNGTPATIYNIRPTLSEMSFSRNSANDGYTPTAYMLGCGYVKTVGSEETVVVNGSGTIDGTYRIFYRITNNSGTATGWTAYTGEIRVPQDTANVSYEFCLSTAASGGSVADSNIIDRENVPVVKSGVHGTDAPTVVFSPSVVNVDADNSGASSSAFSKQVGVTLWAGGGSTESVTLSVVSKPSGVNATVTTVSGRRVIVIGVAKGTAASAYEGAVVVSVSGTVSGRSYSIQQPLSVVANKAGVNGTKIQRVYRSINESTCDYSPDELPTGWSSEKTQITSSNRYRFVCERTSEDGGTTWGAWSAPVIDAYLANDGTSVSIKGSAVGVATGTQTSAQVCAAAGVTPVNGSVVLQNGTAVTAGEKTTYNNGVWVTGHVSEGDGYVTLDGHLWMRTASSVASNRWVDCGQIKGDDGKDAVLYQFHVYPEQIVVDVDGHPSVSSVTITKTKTEGDNTTDVSDFGIWAYKMYDSDSQQYYGTDGTTLTLPVASLIDASTRFITIDDDEVLAPTITIPVIHEHRGKTGPMLYPAGDFDSTYDYSGLLTEKSAPLVHYVNNGTDEYWYPDIDNYQRGSVPSAGAGWIKAENYAVVMAKFLFTQFASLGSFVVCGDYFISQYGTLYSAVGTQVPVRTSRISGYGFVYMKEVDGFMRPYYAATANPTEDKPCYMYFKESDPMAVGDGTDTSWPRFRPAKVMDGRTGEEWMAEGNVHFSPDGNVTIEGHVKATRLERTLGMTDGLKVWKYTYMNGDIGYGDTYYESDSDEWDVLKKEEYYGNDDADILYLSKIYTDGYGGHYEAWLPHPTKAKNRIVEVYIDQSGNATPKACRLQVNEGAEDDGSDSGYLYNCFKYPLAQYPPQGGISLAASYIKLYCDGTYWNVLENRLNINA